MPCRLEQLLMEPERAPFYEGLGGLADNLLTVGTHAGTFLACHACGDSFTLKGESWHCECCGNGYELKFDPADSAGSPFVTQVRVTGLTKARLRPHWYYENENWSVAEFLTQLLRLQPEALFESWLPGLGVETESTALETILCWPRFGFGGKTIQPDFAIGLQRDFVLFEFKKPAGGTTASEAVLGLLCFAAEAARQLARRWHVVLVPGPDSKARAPADYMRRALAADSVSKARDRWAIPEVALAEIQSAPQTELAARVRVFGWESLLRATSHAIRASTPDSWTRQQALEKLRYFQMSRAKLGLLSTPSL